VEAIAKSLDKRALAIVGEVIGLLDLEELCHGMLRALREAVPAEWCALNELPADLPRTISLTEPPAPPEMHAAFARYGLQNPLAAYYLRTDNGRAMRFSDLVTRRELHRLDLYREVYAPLGVEYQIACTLPSGSRQVLGISAYRNALAHTELARGAGRQIVLDDLTALGLTRRQAEVLRLVAMGSSDQDAAATLGIAVRTAQKHLEHCYRALEVNGRSQAAKLAWEAASG
jgi:DNA-binding CsgD family transcriptional regulator